MRHLLFVYSSTSDECDNYRDRCKNSGGYMKPEKFNGITCFETFLVQFNNCAEFNRWNDMQKLHYLRWSLTGAAAQMLWGTEVMNYRQLVARLRSRFGSLDMEEKYQAEIQCRRRKPSETLRELAQDIRRLMMMAYPGDRSDMAERLAKEHFICALDDPELELKVREKEPQTLDSALKAAQRLEVFRIAVKQRADARQRLIRQITESPESTSDTLEDRVTKIELNMRKSQKQFRGSPKQRQQMKDSRKEEKKNDKQRACATTVSSDDSWKESLLQKVRDLEVAQQAADASIKKITAENEALRKEVGRLRHLEQIRSVPVPATYPAAHQENASRPGVSIRKCYNCGEIGHFVRNCPRPRVLQRPNQLKVCACRQGIEVSQSQNAKQAPAAATVSLSNSHGNYVQSGDRIFKRHAVAASTDGVNSLITEQWSLDGIRTAQQNDRDLSYVLDFMKQSEEKPPWNSVAFHSRDVRVLWSMWPRLRVWNGILQRKFEAIDGTSVIWQVVLPSKLRREFLAVIHGGMHGEHLTRKRTAASIQSRAYWPTWSSDLHTFLRECEPCDRCHRRNALKKANLQTPLVGDDYSAQLQRNSTEAFQLARGDVRARDYDTGVKSERFAVGDWVFCHHPGRCEWQKSCIGPYLVVRIIEPVNCVLQKSAKSKPFVVHVDKLKKCHGETPTSWVSGNDQ